MRQNYDSFNYWKNLIRENKTIRSHMFMEDLPTEKSLYMHTLIFGKENGISSQWAYFPNEKSLLGYIQYSFLQEAFYKWIYGKEKLIIDIPNEEAEKIISDGDANGYLSNSDLKEMKKQISILRDCWHLDKKGIIKELVKFTREFNRTWQGDSTEFLYIKIFETPEELGEFVVKSSAITEVNDDFIDKTGIKVEEWREICKSAISDINKGDRFKNILKKNLTDIF